jgi:hypothetical protein
MSVDEYKQLFDRQRRLNRPMFKLMTEEQLDNLTHGTVRADLEKNGRIRFLSFDEFCRRQPHSSL